MCTNCLFSISFIFGTFWEVSIMTNNEAANKQIGAPMRKHLGNVAYKVIYFNDKLSVFLGCDLYL